MPVTDDLDLIRLLLAEPGPSASTIERGRSRLAELAAARPSPPPRGRPAAWWAAAGTGLAAAAVAAVVVATSTPGTAAGGSGRSASGPAAALPALHTARQVLLAAAKHIEAAAPDTGKYWHVAVVTGEILPGGTRAHPFDIVTQGPWAKWYARVVGQREWAIGRPPKTARPMTTADWTAWRAAGSPRGWRLGWTWQGKRFVPDSHGLSMVKAPVRKVWQSSDGVVGYLGQGQPGLTAAQFAALPPSTTRLRAYLFGRARPLVRPGPVSSGGLSASYLVWDEGTQLLTDPVGPQVLAAAFRVLAGLPGVRSLGLTGDPLHRLGYALRSGPKVIVVDPATGTLLAYEYIKPGGTDRPGETLCKVQGSYQVIQGRWPTRGPIGRNCMYYPGYYGRAADGPLSVYSAVLAIGWVNSLPQVPPATNANHSSGGF